GTIGGNICNGVTSADAAPTLKAYDAELEISSLKGTRVMNYLDFNIGFAKVDLREGEILTGIRIKKDSYQNTYGKYIKYSMRRAMDIATLGCSVNVRLSKDKKTIERFRIAFGVAAPTPIRCFEAEKIALNRSLDQKLLEDIALSCQNEVNPRTSWRASKEFRLHLIKELSQKALSESIKKAGGKVNA
ncbi:MAG: FAD binding domain-containing protein, partial [Sphaerochaetaceae bacterium]